MTASNDLPVASSDTFIPDSRITKIEATPLDQLVQVLEISLIFLVAFSLITLVDAVFESLALYEPLAGRFLGERGVGSLDGGNFEAIMRVTIVFNVLLFSFSLIFGLWMRRTRDGWTWAQLGYTTHTPGYRFQDLVRRAIVLGLVALAVQYTIMTLLVYLTSGGNFDQALLVHAFASKDGTLFTSKQLLAEYYFGWVEMGLYWPISAGFFFFAYCHNSLKARFPLGVANLLATLFYVFYLAFFFMIPEPSKLAHVSKKIADPLFWGQLLVFFIILYISFSAFAETRSVVLPFALNFVFNVGLTLFKAINALAFTAASPWMLLPYLGILLVLGVWAYVKRADFSTLRLGLQHLTHREGFRLRVVAGLTALFLFLAFFVPGLLEYIIQRRLADPTAYPEWVASMVYALIFIVIILLAVVVLTYDPTQVHDVLLLQKPSGLPMASRIKLFQSDEVLISGFVTALSSVSRELDAEAADLRTIKRGEREILIEEGVHSTVVALADKEQASIRQAMINLHKKFEVEYDERITNWDGGAHFPEAQEFVQSIGNLAIRFSFPQQTRWIGALALVLGPLMIALIALI